MHIQNNHSGHLQPDQKQYYNWYNLPEVGNRIFGEKLPAMCQKGGGHYGRHQIPRVANGNGKDTSFYDMVRHELSSI